MMPAQLWETTVDPEKRLLKWLLVEDAAEANVVFSLMGAQVSNDLLYLLLEFFSHLIVIGYPYFQANHKIGWAGSRSDSFYLGPYFGSIYGYQSLNFALTIPCFGAWQINGLKHAVNLRMIQLV